MNRNHRWFIYSLFAYFDCAWAYNVISSAVAASGDRYVLSYGQVRVPPLLETH